ncbi:PucR family transcriptional regulator [Microbacterium luticocti]|uniref:PucR family transcriptional regulator n=1 Tax=Microbacterium luticocti TaxID=451764 RepID=UPI00041E0351|nr:PucR family transcriptional regulator [Microbacterium luticocti]
MSAHSRPRRATVGDAAAQLNLTPIVLDAARAERTYGRVMLIEDLPETDATGAIVLGSGIRDATALAAALAALAATDAAALVVRETVPRGDAARQALSDAAVAVLGAPADTDWLRLASYLTEEPSPLHYGVDADRGTTSDLFDLANSLSAVLGGPITIENGVGRILAFSADQARGDEARKQSVLGHQVPRTYTDLLRATGALRRIDTSDEPVYIDDLAPDILPRLALRIRAGAQTLGSIWAIVDGPPTPLQRSALVEAAAAASISLFRQQASTDAVRRLRVNEVLNLLDGGVRAKEAAERLGYRAVATSVLAATHPGHDTDEAAPGDAAAELQRLADALGLYLNQLHPLSVVAPVAGVVYAILPHEHDQPPDTFAQRIATAFAERFRHGRPVLIGVGDATADITQLQQARSQADRALRVLLHTYRDARSRCVVGADEVRIESLLLRLSDALAAEREPLRGPLAALRDHDAAHGTAYVVTLAAWLDAFGDIGRAAAACHVHANTFRYRLQRLQEIAGVDLDDPEARFGLMLQLRLFPAPPR